MNNVRKVSASLIVALLLISLWSAAGRSQDQRDQGRARDNRAATTQKDVQAKPEAMNADEKIVRDVYARLMRYQSASRDVLDARDGKQSGPEDYLTFELRNIHSGPIDEIYDRPFREVATPQGSSLITIKPVHFAEPAGPMHGYYEAAWASQPETGAQPQGAHGDGSTPDTAVQDERKFAGFNRYTSYEVRVHFQGRQLTYRALALYQVRNSAQLLARPARVEIVDNITSQMNTVYNEETPPVRAPWEKYVKTGLYRAIAKSIKAKLDTGKPMRPDDAPVGYLPGDEALADYAINAPSMPIEPGDGGGGDGGGGGGGGGGGTSCATSVSLSRISAVGKNFTRTITVTIDPSTPITLTLATTTGTGSAVFTSNNSATMNVSQTTNVEIKGVTESSTKDNIKLQATQNGSNVTSINFTVIMVTISMRFTDSASTDNAGRTAYSTLLGTTSLGSFLSAGTNQNHIWRNGIEFKGVITPSNFTGGVTLNRIVDIVKDYNDQTLRATDGPLGDTSNGVLRDDDPQSGSSGGKVYDLDAPGLGAAPAAAVGVILRTRINFHAWATVDAGARVSGDFQWFSRQSITKTSSGDQLINDVSNDNAVGTGTTNLTWNLQ